MVAGACDRRRDLFLIAVLLGVPTPVPTAGTPPHIDPAFYKIMIVEGVLGFWGFIIWLKCLGEVHRFSAWRALGALLIVLVTMIIAIVTIGTIVFLIIRAAGHH